MYCSKCGNLVDDNVMYCPKCGAEMKKDQQPVQGNAPTQGQYPPDNYLVWAILSTLFCCLPLGIASIIFASKVDSAYQRGDYHGAMEASRKAKQFATWGAVTALIVWAIYFIVYVVILGAIMGEF